MEKPIIAVPLKGVFIEGEAWEEAHVLWFEKREKELKSSGKNTSIIKQWKKLHETDIEKERKEYFRYVDPIMKLLFPFLSDEERTKKAREWYFQDTIEFIENHPEYKIKEAVEIFSQLKKKYRIGLITTNTKEVTEQIIRSQGLESLFDFMQTSLPEEKDDINIVFDRFIKKYGTPRIYLGTNEQAVRYAKEKGIETASSLKELSQKLKFD